MASHLFNRAAALETRLSPALAVVLAHPLIFVTAVWLAAYVAIAFIA
jgi:hypothetical protein